MKKSKIISAILIAVVTYAIFHSDIDFATYGLSLSSHEIQMPGKRERLRLGEAVELKPGLIGRLNPKDRTLELSNGKKLSISKEDQRDLFPENEEAWQFAREKEETQRSIKKIPAGEFLFQFGQSGVLNALKDWGNKWTQSNNEYARIKCIHHEISEEIVKESPFISGVAKLASILFSIGIGLTVYFGVSGNSNISKKASRVSSTY